MSGSTTRPESVRPQPLPAPRTLAPNHDFVPPRTTSLPPVRLRQPSREGMREGSSDPAAPAFSSTRQVAVMTPADVPERRLVSGGRSASSSATASRVGAKASTPDSLGSLKDEVARQLGVRVIAIQNRKPCALVAPGVVTEGSR